MRRRAMGLLALCAAGLMTAWPLAAHQDGLLLPGEANGGISFTLNEVLQIQTFFRTVGAGNRAPMETMERRLTPAERSSLKKGATLTSGQRTMAVPLPGALASSLPDIPPGLSRKALGLRILLLDRHSKVLDVLDITFDAGKPAAGKSQKK